MHPGCFVWTPTPPLPGRRTLRPGPVPVRVCSSFLAGSGGPASRARFRAPSLFLWPLRHSALLGLLRAGVAPFLVVCWPSPCCPSLHPPPPFFSFCAPFVSCFLWFPAPGALGLGILFFFPPPPPGLWFFFLCAPFVSGFLWFPAPVATGLGAVCCLFCSPPGSWLSLPSCPVGCSLVVVAPPPPPPPSQPRAHPCHPPRVPPEGERCCAVRDRHPPLSCTRATQPHPRSPFPGFAPLPHRHIPRAYSWPCRCAKGRAVASVSTQGTPRVGGPECC